MSLERLIDSIVQDATERGCFDDLPGKGRPLKLDALDDVPAELRASYTVLKNAGYLPEEMEEQRRYADLKGMLKACTAAEEPAIRGELRKLEQLRSVRAARDAGVGSLAGYGQMLAAFTRVRAGR